METIEEHDAAQAAALDAVNAPSSPPPPVGDDDDWGDAFGDFEEAGAVTAAEEPSADDSFSADFESASASEPAILGAPAASTAGDILSLSPDAFLRAAMAAMKPIAPEMRAGVTVKRRVASLEDLMARYPSLRRTVAAGNGAAARRQHWEGSMSQARMLYRLVRPS